MSGEEIYNHLARACGGHSQVSDSMLAEAILGHVENQGADRDALIHEAALAVQRRWTDDRSGDFAEDNGYGPVRAELDRLITEQAAERSVPLHRR